MELAGSVLLGLFVGRWLDEHFAAGSVWTLIGVALGLAAGGRVVWRALQRANREAEQMDQEERRARQVFHEQTQTRDPQDDDHSDRDQ